MREERYYNKRLACVGPSDLPPLASEGNLGGGEAPQGPIPVTRFREIMEALQVSN